MHPVESIDHGAATVDGTEGELAIAGPGAPLVAEFCIADLALALGCPPTRDAPTSATRSSSATASPSSGPYHHGRVPVWKARKIAQATKPLCPRRRRLRRHPPGPPGAPLLLRADRPRRRRRAAPVRPRRGREAPPPGRRCPALRRRPPAGVLRRHRPRRRRPRPGRCPRPQRRHHRRCRQLAELGSDESLDVRRSLAAGALARRELTLDLQGDRTSTAPPARKRELMIYLHLADGSGAPGSRTPAPRSASSRSRNGARAPTPRSRSGPVIDLNEDLHTDTYRPTDACASRRS